MRMSRLILFITVAVMVGSAGVSQAQNRDKEPADGVTVSFTGGIALPMFDTAETHQESMLLSLRMGWIGSAGLGIDLGASYTPLPRQASPSDRYETHFATLYALPRAALDRGRIRVWLGAGGGFAYQHERELDDSGLEVVSSETTLAPLALGAAGLEYHLARGIGLVAESRYVKVFGDLDYDLVAVTGGLVLTFE